MEWEWKRRTVLCTAGLTALAGCLGGNSGDGGDSGSVNSEEATSSVEIEGLPASVKVGEEVAFDYSTDLEDFDTQLRFPGGEEQSLEDSRFTPEESGEYTLVVSSSDLEDTVEEKVTVKSKYTEVQDSEGNVIIEAPEDVRIPSQETVDIETIRNEISNSHQAAIEKDPAKEEVLNYLEDDSGDYPEFFQRFVEENDSEKLKGSSDVKEALKVFHHKFIWALDAYGLNPDVPDFDEEHNFTEDEWYHERNNPVNAAVAQRAINEHLGLESRVTSTVMAERPEHQDEEAYPHARIYDDGEYNMVIGLDKEVNETVISDMSYVMVDYELQVELLRIRADTRRFDLYRIRREPNLVDSVDPTSNSYKPIGSVLVSHGIDYHFEKMMEFREKEVNQNKVRIREDDEDAEVDESNLPRHYNEDVWLSPDHRLWDYENKGLTDYWFPSRWDGEEPDLDWLGYDDAYDLTAQMIVNLGAPELGDEVVDVSEANLALDPDYMNAFMDAFNDPKAEIRNGRQIHVEDLETQGIVAYALANDSFGDEDTGYGMTGSPDQPHLLEIENPQERERLRQGEYSFPAPLAE